MYLTKQDLVRMGLNRKGKWQYTVADIEALPVDVRAELIDGELFVRMEAPLTEHQSILMAMSLQVALYIGRKKGKCHVFPGPFGVYIKKDNHNFVEPDITLICDDEKLDRKGCHGAPDLVIEVVSPSNRKMDYVRKLALYREAGVREYWIADPKHKQVTVYDLEHGKEPELHPFSERIKVGIYDDLYLDATDYSRAFQEFIAEEQGVGQEKGRAEGHAEGREEGRAEGREEGRAEGREEGRAEGRAEGHAEGVREGEARLAALTAVLLREGRTDDLTRALADSAYREGLYREKSL